MNIQNNKGMAKEYQVTSSAQGRRTAWTRARRIAWVTVSPAEWLGLQATTSMSVNARSFRR